MLIEKVEDFSKWLVAELTPIYDADAAALAKYVLALLKKPDRTGDELKTFTLGQLDVFLGAHNEEFVEKMFSVLESKSYINAGDDFVDVAPSTSPREDDEEDEDDEETSENYEPAPSTKKAVTSATSGGEARVTTTTTSVVKKEEPKQQQNRPLRKRISPPPREEKEKETTKPRDRDRRRSRSPRDRRTSRQTHGGNRRRSRSRSSDSRSPTSTTTTSTSHRRSERSSRRRCNDFEKKGFCMRGEQCPYYHGPDPVVVVDENALSNMVPLAPAAAAANFSLPPPGYNPLNPPPPGVQLVAGEYNPETPALTVTNNYSIPPPPLAGAPWSAAAAAGAQYAPPPPPAPYGVQQHQMTQPPPTMMGQPQHQQHQQIPTYHHRGGGMMRGGRGAGRGGRGGGGRGGSMMGGGAGGMMMKEGSTLQVAKIPPEMNTIAKLNEHFATFGTIDNIQVRYLGEPDAALITFATKGDAIRAHKSPTPVLNNRFIKVFWHKGEGNNEEPKENGGAEKVAEAAASEPAKPVEKPKITTGKEAKFISAETQNQRKMQQEAKEKLSQVKAQLSKLVAFQEKQNELLEKWMTKQKTLLVKARSATDETEKKNATKLVKQIHKKIKLCKDEVDSVLMQISEKTVAVDQAMAALEALKVSPTTAQKKEEDGEGETKEVGGRKRKAEDNDDAPTPNTAKVSSVVVVKGVKEADVSDLMSHMEKFGETFDASVKVENGLCIAVFPYKKPEDANKALTEGKTLNGATLDMEMTMEKLEEIPSTDTNMSANELLAAIPSGVESDDEDLLNE